MLVLIPLLPCLGFIANAALGRRLSKSASAVIACGAMLASFGVALVTSWPFLFGSGDVQAVEQNVYTWIRAGDFVTPFSLRVDPLAVLMILVVTGIGKAGSTAIDNSVPTGTCSAPCRMIAPSGELSTALPDGV